MSRSPAGRGRSPQNSAGAFSGGRSGLSSGLGSGGGPGTGIGAGTGGQNGHSVADASVARTEADLAEKTAVAAAAAAAVPCELSRAESRSLLALAAAGAAVLANTVRRDDGAPLSASLAISGIAFASCYAMIRWLGPTFVAAGISGVDLNKAQRRRLPEAMGAVCAVVYLLSMIAFIPVPFYKDIVAATSGGGNRDVVVEAGPILASASAGADSASASASLFGLFFGGSPPPEGRLLHRFPHSKLASYLSAILSLQSITLLGIGDDLFDIRWRHKFFIPAVAAVPLLVVYFVDFGVTSVVVPTPLQALLGLANGSLLLDLGPLYYLYMTAIAIFSPNSINILAGINGIEVAQSLVVAALLILNDALYLLVGPYPHPATDSHLFSLFFLLPFVGVSLALLAHNRFPARVFVGDTYCYFAGMVFVVVSILGHFSKTLLLLLLPQAANFVYSAPQIFGLVPCPRHRMPRFHPRTGLLEPSVTVWQAGPAAAAAVSSAAVSSSAAFAPPLPPQPSPPVAAALRLLARLRLLRLRTDPDTGALLEASNMTLLNLWLVWRGPLREDRLALEVTAMQVVVGLLGLFVRHRLALLLFAEDNWGTH